MKATGIVRRVDDLGRIVIPKEIRRTLRIREGDPLEIYTEKDGGVIFRKYSPMGDLQEFAAQMCDAISSSTGHIAELMIKGSNNGIIEMEKALKHNERAGQEAIGLAKQMIDFEQGNIRRLKEYL